MSTSNEDIAETASVQPQGHVYGISIFLIVITLFALSGFSSLVYQVVWTRMLVFVFGSTVFASSTVLAVFMGGLALGAFVAGRFCDRLARPFLWYGILEGIIGIWALFAPFLFDAAIPIYKSVWQTMHLSVLPFSLIRFAVAASILIIPTTCMGATLPLLSRFVTVNLDKVAGRIGILYSVNTLGAVIGAMIAGFVMLPEVGLKLTLYFAVGTNLLLLAIVLFCSRRYEHGKVLELIPETAELASANKQKLPAPVIASMIAFAMSGAVAMTYEVAWTRTLLMVIGSTTYAFTIMLATFLVGLFAGSLICARFVDRIDKPMVALVLLQVMICFAGLVCLSLFSNVPYWTLVIQSTFGDDPNRALAGRFLLSGAVLFPITLCLGAVFPIVVKICAGSLESIGRSVGTLYSANTVGAIIGAFVAGFVIIPWLGVEKTLLWASLANLFIAYFLAFFLPMNMKQKVIGGSACAVALGLAGMQESAWDRGMLLSAQQDRRKISPKANKAPSLDEWTRQIREARKVAFWEDGACATVGVIQRGRITQLVTNGHVDATDGLDMRNQILVAAYPMLFHPQPQNVAVIGWGSGVTVGAASLFPSLQKLVCVEIEEAVLNAAKTFAHVNHSPEKNTKVISEINDGRNYLLATNEKFDTIISEPSNPWQPGVCNLFTSEFFAVCKDRLKDDGLLAAWLQFEEVAPGDLRHVLAAVSSNFKYVLPLESDGCMILLASNQPIKMDETSISRLMQNQKVAADLQVCGITSPADLFARIICSPDMVQQIAKGVDPNSDDRNYLEFNVGKTYESKTFTAENRIMLNNNIGTPWSMIDWGKLDAKARAAFMVKVSESALKFGVPERAYAWGAQSMNVSPSAEGVCAGALALAAMGRRVEAERFFETAIKNEPANSVTYLRRGSMNLNSGDVLAARADFSKAVSLHPEDREAKLLLAKTFSVAGRPASKDDSAAQNEDNPDEVLKLVGDLPRDREFVAQHPEVLLIAGMANAHKKNLDLAQSQLSDYTKLNSNTVLGWRGLGSVLMVKGDHLGAAACWQNGLIAGANQAATEITMAANLIRGGEYAPAVRILEHSLEFAPNSPAAIALLREVAPKNPKAVEILRKLNY